MKKVESLEERWKREDRWLFFWIVATVLGLSFGGSLLMWLGSSKACSDFAENTGQETKYSFWSCCYVKVDGRWVCEGTLRTLRNVDE